ncbi:MAG: hypothetical protein ABJN40_01680 [Sneathiella sp.]
MQQIIQRDSPIDIQYETQTTENFCYKVCHYSNKVLFGGLLPPVQIFLKPLRSSCCTFEAEVIDHISGKRIDRITVNSRFLKGIPIAKLVMSLMDAVVSQQQHHFGKPGRGSYRNKERAAFSREIGLIPSSTGEKGGKETGEKVSFYCETGSRVDHLIQELLSLDFANTWQDRPAQQ